MQFTIVSWPPSSFTSDFDMASPSPVPPYSRLVSLLAWLNGEETGHTASWSRGDGDGARMHQRHSRPTAVLGTIPVATSSCSTVRLLSAIMIVHARLAMHPEILAKDPAIKACLQDGCSLKKLHF